MRPVLRIVLAAVSLAGIAIAVAAAARVARVNKASRAIPVYPGAREGGGRTRYFPRLISWDDRSSARVQRVFAFSRPIALGTIALEADARLAAEGWYLVMPDELDASRSPQVIVWQRDPDERLDLMQVWPVSGMDRTQRLYGGIFPAEFLEAPLVVEWSWALGGPRSPRNVMVPWTPTVAPPPPPPTP
jgi:hypothetical protein